MYAENMVSKNGSKVINQFTIIHNSRIYFQSYRAIIASKNFDGSGVEIDRNFWDYSAMTDRYRSVFLGETKRETRVKISSGEYTLTNLNQDL